MMKWNLRKNKMNRNWELIGLENDLIEMPGLLPELLRQSEKLLPYSRLFSS